MLELTAANIEKTLNDNAVVLIDFWAPWCGPCRAFAPIFERVSAKHPDVVFAKVNTDVEQKLAREFGIESIPTLIAFREQIIVHMQAGALPEAALEGLLKQVRGMDMDVVRAEIAKADGEQGEGA